MRNKNSFNRPKEALLPLLALLVWFLIPVVHHRALQDQTEVPKAAFATLSALLLTAAVAWCQRHRSAPYPWPLRIFFGLFLWQCLGWPFAASPELGTRAFFQSWSSLAWLYLAWELFERPVWRRHALTAVSLSGLLAAIYGLSQYEAVEPGAFPSGLAAAFKHLATSVPGFGFLAPLDQTDAPGSFFGHTNVAAELVAMATAVVLVRVLKPLILGPRHRPALLKAFVWALVLLPLGLFVLRSGSRSVMLALVAVGGAMWLHLVVAAARRAPLGGRMSRHFLIHCSLIALVGATALFGLGALKTSPRSQQAAVSLEDRLKSAFDPESTTVRERLDLWLNTTSMIEDHPVFGVGLGNFRVVYPEYADRRRSHELGRYGLRRQPVHPHNEYLALAAEHGLFGLILFLGFLAAVVGPTVWHFSAFRSQAQAHEAEALAALAALGVVLMTGLFAFPLQQTATRVGLVVMAAIMMRSWPERANRPLVNGPGLQPVIGIAALVGLVVALAHYRAEWKSSIAVREVTQPQSLSEMSSLELGRTLDQALARSPWRLDLALVRAQRDAAAGILDAARAEFTGILKLHPSLTNAWMGLARVDLAAGSLTGARQALARAVRLQPREPRLRLAIGDLYRAMGDRRLAIEQYEEALALEPIGPDRLVAYLSLSRIYSEADQTTSALHWLEQARALAPLDPVVAEARARFMERHNPGSEQAVESWRILREQRPLHAEAQLRCGQAEMRAGAVEAALQSFEAAYLADSNLVIALYERGAAQAALGRLAEARGSLIECLRKTRLPESRDPVLFERARSLIAAIEARAVNEGLMEQR